MMSVDKEIVFANLSQFYHDLARSFLTLQQAHINLVLLGELEMAAQLSQKYDMYFSKNWGMVPIAEHMHLDRKGDWHVEWYH